MKEIGGHWGRKKDPVLGFIEILSQGSESIEQRGSPDLSERGSTPTSGMLECLFSSFVSNQMF